MSEPLRVLMLFTILNRGGAETMVMNYYRHMDRRRVQFDFAVHREERGAYEDEIEQLGGRIFRFMPLRPWTIPQYKRQIKRFFDEHPDYRIIHGQCSESGYYFYREATRRGVPVIIAHAHNAHVPFDAKLIFRTWLKHRMRSYITHRFTCGKEAAEWLFGKEEAKSAVLQRNAINTGAFCYNQATREHMRQALAIEHDTLAVVHVGRFERQKNHQFVVRVFQQLHRQHPAAHLFLVGSGGGGEPSMRDLVDSLQLGDAVCFLGSRSDMPQVLCAMDAFLFPSLTEGFPLSLLEAQCTGLPCVISDQVPQEACLTDLVSRLSLSADVKDWADAVIRSAATQHNRQSYAQQIADAGYDIEENAQWLQAFYTSSIKS